MSGPDEATDTARIAATLEGSWSVSTGGSARTEVVIPPYLAQFLAAALTAAGFGDLAQARAETWDEAVATVERQTNLSDLVHFDKPSDFRKGVLTSLMALTAARDAARIARGDA